MVSVLYAVGIGREEVGLQVVAGAGGLGGAGGRGGAPAVAGEEALRVDVARALPDGATRRGEERDAHEEAAAHGAIVAQRLKKAARA